MSEDLLVIARRDRNINFRLLLQALAVAQQSIPCWRGFLRVVGRGTGNLSELKALRCSLLRRSGLELIDQLRSEELLSLLRSRFALVSASIEEGFDYPVLEAKGEGIPTIISDIPVHREFHSESSLFFRSTTMAKCLLRNWLLNDAHLQKQLSAFGHYIALSLSVKRQKIN